MNVRQLMDELALHPPETIVIVRADDNGFTEGLVVESIKVRPARPPIAGISHRPAEHPQSGGQAFKALLIGPPERF